MFNVITISTVFAVFCPEDVGSVYSKTLLPLTKLHGVLSKKFITSIGARRRQITLIEMNFSEVR